MNGPGAEAVPRVGHYQKMHKNAPQRVSQTEQAIPLNGLSGSKREDGCLLRIPAEVEREERPLPGYPRLRLHSQFHSHILPADRNLIVYVPEQYNVKPQRSFPVLYLQDGQNLFDGRTSYIPGKTWCVQETADRLIASGEVEPLIVVGVYNTGESRLVEYTPTRDSRMGGGGAALYGRMLIDEIAPYISRHYRTLAGPQNTGGGGSSLGGLLSLYLGLEYPEVFGKLAVLSPSVWWDQRSILPLVRAAFCKPSLRIWLDIGTAEGKRSLQDADLLYRLLVKRGWSDGTDMRYLRVKDGTHDEAAWAQRVGPMLKFLFPLR